MDSELRNVASSSRAIRKEKKEMDSELRNVASSSRAIRKKRGSTQMIPVPSNLVESYGGVMSSKVTFRSGEYGKKWRVKIKKFNNQYFFTDGWKEFAAEVNLKSRELVMHRTASSIRRSLFGKNEEKRRKMSGNAHGTKISSLDENNGSGVQKKLSLVKVLKKSHKYIMSIPYYFAESAGLLEKDEIKLKNSEGREWRVHVTRNYNGVFLSGEWIDFTKDNNMGTGNTLSFISSSSDTIDVQIVKQGTDKEPLSFHKVIEKCHNYYLGIPRNFLTTNGKLERDQINLKNSEGREWPVRVIHKGPNDFALSGGWLTFLKDNNVVLGSLLSFSLISCDTIDVQIVNEGPDKQALFKYLNVRKVFEGGNGYLNNASDHAASLSASEEEMDSESEESE